jgi:hypothetical protein
MSTEAERQSDRRKALLDSLEQAESLWGARMQTMLEKEASFLKKVIQSRLGISSGYARIQDELSSLTVEKIDDFLIGPQS